MIKDYIIKERLGTGAFGIVYKVLKQSNNLFYVIKQIPLFGLTKKQINDVVKAAMSKEQMLYDLQTALSDMTKGSKEWKYLGGKYYYNTQEEREVMGEKLSPWDELKFDEEGLMLYSEMMKIRKK